MNLPVFLLCLIMGVVMTFHVSMNARIGTITGDPIFTNMVFWVLGATVAVGSYLLRPSKPGISEVLSVPLWLYAAGIIGVFVSLGVVYLIPRAGIAGFTVLILAGQLACSAILSSTDSSLMPPCLSIPSRSSDSSWSSSAAAWWCSAEFLPRAQKKGRFMEEGPFQV